MAPNDVHHDVAWMPVFLVRLGLFRRKAWHGYAVFAMREEAERWAADKAYWDRAYRKWKVLAVQAPVTHAITNEGYEKDLVTGEVDYRMRVGSTLSDLNAPGEKRR